MNACAMNLTVIVCVRLHIILHTILKNLKLMSSPTDCGLLHIQYAVDLTTGS